jgi:hypothetical protein
MGAVRMFTEEPIHPFAHFACGFVCERQRQDGDSRLFKEPGNAEGKHARLSRPGTGEHKQRTVLPKNGF